MLTGVSCAQLQLKYVDLYLIHNPRLIKPDMATIWAQMEEVYAAGYAKCVHHALRASGTG